MVMDRSFLLRNRTVAPTVEMAPPSGTPDNGIKPPPGITGSLAAGPVSFSGRVSLGVLGGVIIGMVAFYVWTRSAQGGG